MNGRKINIAFILPSLDRGGVSSASLNIINELDAAKYNKFIVLYDGKIIEYKTDIEIIDMKTPKADSVPAKILTQFKRYYRLRKIKSDKKIDISISFKDNPNITSLFAKKNDKIIMTVHTTPSRDYTGSKGRIYKYLIGRYFNRADKIVAVSDGIKNDLEKNYQVQNNKIQTIYNFIDIKHIAEMSEEHVEIDLECLFNTGKTVINVGRLSDAKGHWHLIRAFKQVSTEIPDSKLIIVGDGELRPYLTKLIGELSLKNSVHLIGNRDNPYKYMKNSDLFVLSSVYEGFGIVLIEAMACGIPVISTNCLSGPEEILKNNEKSYGILIPVCDGKKYSNGEPLTAEEKVMAENIIRLLKNKLEADEIKALSLKRASEFSSDKIIPQWESLIDELYKGNNL
jgi:glycosyltransferase involved in cell wall biosynthesis